MSARNSFFLFGARGTGKSTLIEQRYHFKKTLWIDLLLYEEEEKFSQNPDELLFILNKGKYKTVVIPDFDTCCEFLVEEKIKKPLDIGFLGFKKP